ncbi:MAG: hypothetical protein R3C19_07640 [Planctomycetaceae bacterium]
MIQHRFGFFAEPSNSRPSFDLRDIADSVKSEAATSHRLPAASFVRSVAASWKPEEFTDIADARTAIDGRFGFGRISVVSHVGYARLGCPVTAV